MGHRSRLNPRLSAYIQLWGSFNFNTTPLALRCKVVINERPHERGTWTDHGFLGYYVVQAIGHYRNYRCYVPGTRGERVSNAVEFSPHHIDMPFPTPDEALISVLQDLVVVLHCPNPSTPFLAHSNATVAALKELVTIFDQPGTPTSNKLAPPPPRATLPEPPTPQLRLEKPPRVHGPSPPRVPRNLTPDTPTDCHVQNPDLPRWQSLRFLSLEQQRNHIANHVATERKIINDKHQESNNAPPPPDASTQVHLSDENSTYVMPTHFAYAVFDETRGKLLEY